MLKYNRILLKLSGEALAGNKEFGFSSDVLQSFARQVKEVHDKGVEVAIVIGGGNIFRWSERNAGNGFDRVNWRYNGNACYYYEMDLHYRMQ